MKSVVLVTAIGTMASTTIISKLKETNEYYIIGADIFPRNEVATAKDVNEFYSFPSAIENFKGFVCFVLDFCKKKKVNFYFPTIDEEVVNLSNHIDLFYEIGVRLCIPNYDLVECCHYKDRFVSYIHKEFPELYIKTFDRLENIPEEEFPIYIKPVEGRASNDCRRFDSKRMAEEFITGTGYKPNAYVIQKYTEGTIFTVDLIRNSATGQKEQVQRKELLRNGNGCGIAVEIVNDEILKSICNDLMLSLNLHGVVNAEFFLTNMGYKIIEINPRFSAGCGFTCMAGCNLVLNALMIADSKICDFGKITYGKHYAKRYEIYQLD